MLRAIIVIAGAIALLLGYLQAAGRALPPLPDAALEVLPDALSGDTGDGAEGDSGGGADADADGPGGR